MIPERARKSSGNVEQSKRKKFARRNLVLYDGYEYQLSYFEFYVVTSQVIENERLNLESSGIFGSVIADHLAGQYDDDTLTITQLKRTHKIREQMLGELHLSKHRLSNDNDWEYTFSINHCDSRDRH
jgi:hypothetical protein